MRERPELPRRPRDPVRGPPTAGPCRSCASVRDSASGEGNPIAHDVYGLRWQLAKRGPFHPGRSEIGPDAEAAIEVRTVDAPPAAEIALIAVELVQAELDAPAAGRAGWHWNALLRPGCCALGLGAETHHRNGATRCQDGGGERGQTSIATSKRAGRAQSGESPVTGSESAAWYSPRSSSDRRRALAHASEPISCSA
jgi:hypothetical protein